MDAETTTGTGIEGPCQCKSTHFDLNSGADLLDCIICDVSCTNCTGETNDDCVACAPGFFS